MYQFFSTLAYVTTMLSLGLLNFFVLQAVIASSVEILNV